MAKTPEHARLEEARTGAVPWKAWGPYLSERQWGTVREDYSAGGDAWNYFTPRPGALARVPLGRGRHRRDLRRPPAAVPGARAVERRRPDPQGADVRAHQQRGQPRRGRQGVLVLPRQHADALLPEVRSTSTRSAAFPYADLVATNRAPRQARTSSTSCSTPACSTTTATSTWRSSTPRPRPTTSLMLVTAHNRGPEAATLHLLPTLWFRNTWSWGGPAEAGAGAPTDGGAVRDATHELGEWRLHAERAAAVLRERDEQRAAVRRAQHRAAPEGRDQRLRGPRRRGGNPGAAGTKCAAHHVLEVARGGQRRRSACGCAARRRGRPAGRLRRRAGRPPRRGRRVLRHRDPAGARRRPRARDAPGAGRPAVGQAVLRVRRPPLAARARRQPVGPERAGERGAQRALVPHGRRRRDLDAGQVGVPVVRRLGPGVPLRAAVAGRRRLRQGRRSSCCCSTRYQHPNGQIPAYEWNF